MTILILVFSAFLVSSKEEEEIEEVSQLPCEKCGKLFWPNVLLRHIGKSKKCKTFYGPRFDVMKKQKHRDVM